MNPTSLIDQLEAALHAERTALIEHNVEALIVSTQRKLDVLCELEQIELDDIKDPADYSRLIALSEINRINGTLLALRRREVNWALRFLGRAENNTGYNAQGQARWESIGRSIAVV